jgi:hypothetical protein
MLLLVKCARQCERRWEREREEEEEEEEEKKKKIF